MKTVICDASHNEELKKIAAVPVPGSIELSYRRETDYFRGVAVQGENNTVIATLEGKEIAATVTRSLKRVYVNGRPMTIGYLSGLRVLPPYRGRMHLAAGYRFLHTLDKNLSGTPYLCTFIRGNTHALRVLLRPRKGLLHYYFLDRFHTYSLFVPGRLRRSGTTVRLRRGDELDRDKIIRFLQVEGRRKQFFPVYDNQALDGYFGHFDWRQLRVLLEGEDIVGTLGVWDQSDYKQVDVVRYSPLLACLRPVINLGLKGTGLSCLPHAPGRLKPAYLALMAVRDNDPAYLDKLVTATLAELGGTGYHYLLACLCERDSLNRVFRSRFHIRYDSDLYLAAWEENPQLLQSLHRQSIPYLELGTL